MVETEYRPGVFILDVDGVMTDGGMYYTADGKVMKRFGADDHDALRLISKLFDIRFCSGDRSGFDITSRRIAQDMGFRIDLVSTIERSEWIGGLYDPKAVVYMGDGIFDGFVFEKVGYSIAPRNAMERVKCQASFVTEAAGGRGAVAEACLHLASRFHGLDGVEDLVRCWQATA